MVNNAGGNYRVPVLDYPEEEWDRVINTKTHSSLNFQQKHQNSALKSDLHNYIKWDLKYNPGQLFGQSQ
jgi:NAD(P)-dependent dehydrogenase (short-subunit alcohol dehydrogenase family)